MGSGEIRDLASTTAGQCKSGYLAEHYFASGNMHGDSEAVAIACLTTADKADWVWLAGTQCEGSRVCAHRKRRPTPFASPREHLLTGRPSDQSSPATMTYNVERAIRGERCTVRSYKLDENPDSFWDCERYTTLIATEGLLKVTTTGPTKQVVDYGDGAPNLPLTASVPPDAYTVDEVTPLVDVP